MRDAAARRHLGFAHVHVVQQLRSLKERLVLRCIHEHRGTAPVLRQDNRTLRALNLPYDGR
jgi:hypothetical protein